MKPHEIFAALLAFVDSNPELLRLHRTDLTTHDRAWLEQNPGRPFAWLATQASTHIVDLGMDRKVQEWDGQLDRTGEPQARALARTFGPFTSDRPGIWFFFDGVRLSGPMDLESTIRKIDGLRELRELAGVLRRFGYDPNDAGRLLREGIGPYEAEHRIRSTTPGEVGSLEHTHRLSKRAA